MKETSGDVRQICEAKSMSALSIAVVYLAICSRMIASVLPSSTAPRGATAHKTKQAARHKATADTLAGVTLFRFLIVDVLIAVLYRGPFWSVLFQWEASRPSRNA